MELDAVLLARIQFGFTITFHIIFPSFTIGLAAFIATLLVRWRLTGRDHLHRLARFWTKIFAVSFAMGVVSGIVLSYQFGTNWSNFSVVVGNVLGPLLGYEVLTAFFLEATFLGIMLFGWQRVPPNLHVLSAVLVAVGTSLSAFWILAANSWMQTPAGHEVVNGIAYPVDWVAIIFNPSFPYRFAHMFTAAYLTTSLVVLAVGARYLFKDRFPEEAKTMMRMGLGMVAILAPLQVLIGDQHGLNTLKHQPAKIAAIESHWDGSEPGALVLFAIPNEKEERNDFEIAIPYGASLILTHKHRWAVPRPEGVRAQRPAAGFPGLPVVPPDGRNGRADAAHRLRRRVAVVPGAAVRYALVSAVRAVRLAARLHRHPRRLVHDRDRAPAVDRHRHPAHCGCRLAGPCGGSVDDIDPLLRRLRHRVLDGHLLHQSPHRIRTQGHCRRNARRRAVTSAHCGRAGRARRHEGELV